MGNNKSVRLRKLLADLESKTVDNYDTLATTIMIVLKDTFGKESEFVERADGIDSGWDVEGVYQDINGLYPKGKFEQNKFQAYKNLLVEAIRAVEEYGIGKIEKESSKSSGSNVINIKNFNAHESVISFGDMKDVTNSIDNSVREIQREIDKKVSGEEAEELKDYLNEIKDYLEECQQEQKILKKPGLFSKLGNHFAKHEWFYGAITQLIGAVAIQYIS